MKITKNTIRKIIYIEVVFTLVYQTLISLIGAPSSISYFFDACNVVVLLFVLIKRNKQNIVSSIGAKQIMYIVICLSLSLLVGDILNVVKPTLIVWAIRNNYRFFLFFFACALVLTYKDVEKIFGIICWFQIPNVLLTIYQFIVLGKKQDYLGGIFGMQQGCNAYTNVFLCAIVAFTIAKYISKKTDLKNLVWIIVSSLSIAAVAELKVFFIEFIVVALFSILLSKPTSKTIKILFGSVAGLAVGLYTFSQVFPDAYQDLININRLVEYNTTVVWGYNISRWGAFKEINNIFFNNSLFLNLFGFGFGNCEYSSVPIFTSDFYKAYGSYHYRWFAHQTWFLETGYIGFGLFLLFFVFIFIWALKEKNRMKQANEYILGAQLLSLVAIISLWYNNSTRVEISYLLFFALATPFAVRRSMIEGEYK